MTVVEVHPEGSMNVCIKLGEKSEDHQSHTSTRIHERPQNLTVVDTLTFQFHSIHTAINTSTATKDHNTHPNPVVFFCCFFQSVNMNQTALNVCKLC